MKKDVLVRKGQHMGPMYAVLSRYGIGKPDKYDRGLWISVSDIPAIKSGMLHDRTLITDFWGHPCTIVQGTCRHNHVGIDDFEDLFAEVAS